LSRSKHEKTFRLYRKNDVAMSGPATLRAGSAVNPPCDFPQTRVPRAK
jgi:hypothetical protein